MYHTVDYNLAAAAAGATNSDMTFVTDTIISPRNGHAIFSEKYSLWMMAAVGASVTRGRIQVPTYNAIGEWTIFNANRALTPPSNPQWDTYWWMPVDLPLNEEFQVQMSNNLGAATEQENVVIQIAPTGYTPLKAPMGARILQVRASFTVTPTINAWSGAQAITFSQALLGGTYAILDTRVQGANAVAYRWLFPRAPLVSGRILRPGGLVQTAIGDVTPQLVTAGLGIMGVQGLFFTFEAPSIEVLGATAAGTTYQIFMTLAYLGKDTNQAILNNYINSGNIQMAA